MTAGTAAWVFAFVALLPFTGALERSGRGWWIWTCLAGVGLGLFGIEYCRRRAARSPGARDQTGPPYRHR